MAAMFYILSFLLYAKWRLVKEKHRTWPWFAGCVLAGLLALGSKETAATLPFFILLYEWYFFQDLSKTWLRRSIPYVIGTLILFGLLAFAYMGPNPFERILSGYATRDFTLAQRVLTEFRVVIYYICLLAYPHPFRLNLDHDFSLSYSFMDPITTSLSLISIMALIALAVLIARNERLISFGILWFFGNLAIESSVIPLEIMFEHRVYLPSMFFFLSIVVLAYRFIRPYWDWVVVVVLIAVTLLFSMWTYERNSVWRDPIIFWSDVVKKSPDKARPRNNLGIAYTEKGLIKKAIIEIKKALRLKPDFVNAYVSLGNAYVKNGLIDMAILHYKEALRLRPDYGEVYVNIGNALINKGLIDQAIVEYKKSISLEPEYVPAHVNLASAYGLKGFTEEVLAEYKALAELQPDNPDIHFNLGIAYERLAKSEEQGAERRGHVVMVQEQRWLIEQAINEYKKALKLNPNDLQARRNIDRISRKWYKNQTAID